MCEMPNHLQAIIRELESWVWVRGFPALASHLATAGTIGTQEALIPSHADVSGPEYPSNPINTTAGSEN